MKSLGKAIKDQVEGGRLPRSRKGSDALNSRVKIMIYKSVVEDPGLKISDIARNVEKSETTVRWHLRKMKEKELIRMDRLFGGIHVVPRNVYSEDILRTCILLKGSRKRIIQRIQSEPGITQGDLSDKTDISRGSLSRHLELLEEEELVRTVKEGSSIRYFPGEDYAAFEKTLSSGLRDVRDKLAQILRNEIPQVVSLFTKETRVMVETPKEIYTFSPLH